MKRHPVTGDPVPDARFTMPVYQYSNPRETDWPAVDFIVGNPPFLGASRMREVLGDEYSATLRKTMKGMPDSADFVMYWWDRAADLARRGKVKRFGFVTTNSLRQTFNRRVVERHIRDKQSLTIVFAIPDHPWVDQTDSAAVRVAMTVGEAGEATGLLHILENEKANNAGAGLQFSQHRGRIQVDLSVGAAVVTAVPLASNSNLSNHGVIRGGAGFLVTVDEARKLGLGRIAGLDKHLRPIVNGKDLTQTRRGVYVIDLYGLSEQEVQRRFPEVYQHLLGHVMPVRAESKRSTRKEKWWLFNESVPKLRQMLAGLPRYISTSETAKHRVFFLLDHSVLPEHKLVNFALSDAFFLGVLSSRVHVAWALANRSNLGVGNDPVYVKTRCFETFPFPDCSEPIRERLREAGEALNDHRRRRQTRDPELTVTSMYNVLEKLRSGDALSVDEKDIHDRGLISILKKLHDDLDAAVFAAYAWPGDVRDEQILERLVALNAERAKEEKRGLVRWLRPEFQTAATAESAEIETEPATKVMPKPRKGPGIKSTRPEAGKVRRKSTGKR
jgi:hypothetical protein